MNFSKEIRLNLVTVGRQTFLICESRDLHRVTLNSPSSCLFCKKSLPVSISDTHYLHNMVRYTEIKKKKGWDAIGSAKFQPRDGNMRIQPFDLNVLREAFELKKSDPVDLPVVSIMKLHAGVLNVVMFLKPLQKCKNL